MSAEFSTVAMRGFFFHVPPIRLPRAVCEHFDFSFPFHYYYLEERAEVGRRAFSVRNSAAWLRLRL